LESTLVEHKGPWILGSDPTLADINPMPHAARLDYPGLLDLWIKDRPHAKAWWNTARDWPSFKFGLHDLISEAEFSEMKTHGPKIPNEVAEIAALRREALAVSASQKPNTCAQCGMRIEFMPFLALFKPHRRDTSASRSKASSKA
jgi:hypothetical protein